MTWLPMVRPACLAAVLVACAVVAVAPVRAQTAPGRVAAGAEQGPAWSSLTAAQRQALQPLQSEWATIDAGRKKKWLEVANRLPSLSQAEQSRVQVRMAEWARMSPSDRGRARLQFQESRQLTSTDREERWRAYQSLPADQRQALAAKAGPAAPAKPTASASPSMSSGMDMKKNTVPFLPAPRAKPVGPTVVQSRPGATTSLVTRQAPVPAHQQAGMPKIAATKGFVDPSTLLPKRGPQGAAMAAAPDSAKRDDAHP